MERLNDLPKDRRTSFFIFANDFKHVFGIDLYQEKLKNYTSLTEFVVEYLSYKIVIFIFKHEWSLIVSENLEETSIYSISSKQFAFLKHFLLLLKKALDSTKENSSDYGGNTSQQPHG